MRAAVVVTVILGVAAPPVTWTASADAAPKAGAMALASPASSACALLRDSVKADKTFAGDWLATVDRLLHDVATEYTTDRISLTTHASQLDLHNPPLAPRPPPLV